MPFIEFKYFHAVKHYETFLFQKMNTKLRPLHSLLCSIIVMFMLGLDHSTKMQLQTAISL